MSRTNIHSTMIKNLDSIIPVSDEGLYPIRTVSEVSGVNSITLRAWERRYGLFSPKRTPKGHRLYSDKDIQRIHQVLALLAKGVAIGRVAQALKEEKTAAIFSDITPKKEHSSHSKKLTNTQWKNHQDTLLSNINTYDVLPLEIFHHDLLSRYKIETLNKNLFRPVLEKLKNRAKQLPSLSASYYFYRIFLTHRMGGLFLKTSIKNTGRKILLMGIDDKQNEIELLLFSMSLLSNGYQVVILGCDVAFDAIPMALSSSNSEGLLLFSDANNTNQVTTNEFQTLVCSLKTPVFLTGQYSEHQTKGLLESGLCILPSDYQKRIEMIDKNLNKVIK